jgi:hypothetical protein
MVNVRFMKRFPSSITAFAALPNSPAGQGLAGLGAVAAGVVAEVA